MTHQQDQMWVIVRKLDGWYVVDFRTCEELAGPYQEHESAVETCGIRAVRVSRGWRP